MNTWVKFLRALGVVPLYIGHWMDLLSSALERPYYKRLVRRKCSYCGAYEWHLPGTNDEEVCNNKAAYGESIRGYWS